MIRSMTGFASAEELFEFGRLSWEVRSVNHRYLEYSLRLPEEFRVLEPQIRDMVGRYVSRGKIDATLRYHEMSGTGGARLSLNRERAADLLAAHASFAEMVNSSPDPDLSSLLRWPGLVEEQLPDPAPLHAAALKLLEQAAQGLQDVRRREGQHMTKLVEERLQGVDHWTSEVRSWLPEIRTALHTRMSDRAADLGQSLDPERLAQEVAVLAQKMDVDEELDRLDAHVAETRRTLQLEEPVGRRLDFLMQEFNRESNTLSSKSVDSRTTQAAVELKVLIEQMREQVQNVE